MVEENPKGIESQDTDQETTTGLECRVVLYNDDWHSFDEVIFQLIKATSCTFEKARDLAFETHVKGKSVVFGGQLSACLKVSSVLEEIELHTQILS